MNSDVPMLKNNSENNIGPGSTNQKDDNDNCYIYKELYIKKSDAYYGFCIKGGKQKALGVYVTDVEKNSAADLAGLKRDDFILSINDVDFTDFTIQQAISFLLTTKNIIIRVRRGNCCFLLNKPPPTTTTSTTMNKLNMLDMSSEERQKLQVGSYLKNSTKRLVQMARQNLTKSFGFTLDNTIDSHNPSRLFVKSIEENSIASNSNLKIGDEILEVNGKKIKSIKDFHEVFGIFKNALLLRLVVKPTSLFNTLPTISNSSRSSCSNMASNVTCKAQSSTNLLADPRMLAKRRSKSASQLEQLINQLSDTELTNDLDTSKRQLNRSRRKTADIYEKIVKTNANKNSLAAAAAAAAVASSSATASTASLPKLENIDTNLTEDSLKYKKRSSLTNTDLTTTNSLDNTSANSEKLTENSYLSEKVKDVSNTNMNTKQIPTINKATSSNNSNSSTNSLSKSLNFEYLLKALNDKNPSDDENDEDNDDGEIANPSNDYLIENELEKFKSPTATSNISTNENLANKEDPLDWQLSFVNSSNVWNQSSIDFLRNNENNEMTRYTNINELRINNKKNYNTNEKSFSYKLNTNVETTKEISKTDKVKKFLKESRKSSIQLLLDTIPTSAENKINKSLGSLSARDELEAKALKNKSKTKIEYEQPLSLLPCSTEISLPTEDSVLNIESESVIPEVPLHTKIVLDYEYPIKEFKEEKQQQQQKKTSYSTLNSIRYGTYKSKALSNHIQRTPDGLVLIKIYKQDDWPNLFGIKLNLLQDKEKSVKNFQIKGFTSNGVAERLNFLEPGMQIKKINENDLSSIRSVKEAENYIEEIYKHYEQINLLVKPKDKS